MTTSLASEDELPLVATHIGLPEICKVFHAASLLPPRERRSQDQRRSIFEATAMMSARRQVALLVINA